MTNHDLTGAVWHKSTRSGGGQNCVEVAENLPQVVAVRDTKDRDGGTLFFSHGEWAAFLSGVRNGEFDLPA
ncbi:DUF397 domain-containing protein [Actinoplanes sp. HUAS TT8]|uniref:DUF397 domain-containing protein n=1 Tax=Actinoplanes sp. HUAS TT8 TaxID=3447453 RepID=UPI003F524A9B